MADASPGLPWLVATTRELRQETRTSKTIVFDVPGWSGHLAGQHIDMRLTAEDGYVAQRSFSLASPEGKSGPIEITVQLVPDGEVSPFLLEELRIGDRIELRGPIGGYFTWSAFTGRPLMLIGGGSGIVPLMSMLRTRRDAGDRGEARLLYSARTFDEIIYRRELEVLSATPGGPAVIQTLTRGAPGGWSGEQGRIGISMLEKHAIPAHQRPDIFVCGPTTFVEVLTETLLTLGYPETSIRTERFGPTGEAK